MGKVLEFTSMMFLGILLVLAMTHFLNGTLIQWVQSKFSTSEPPVAQGKSTQPPANTNVQSNSAAGIA